jgi:hypothetical protein
MTRRKNHLSIYGNVCRKLRAEGRAPGISRRYGLKRPDTRIAPAETPAAKDCPRIIQTKVATAARWVVIFIPQVSETIDGMTIGL